MMTRKDYVAVADILNLFRDEVATTVMRDIVNEFSDMFAEDNKNFNHKKFYEAVFAEEMK